MLNSKLLALAILGAMVAAPLVAIAAPGDHGKAEDAKARHDALKEARAAALASFHENRTAVLEAYQAQLASIKDSFLENKSRLLAECRGVHNATFEHTNKSGLDAAAKAAWAHCVRDGMRALRDDARKELREAFHDAMTELRTAAKAALKDFRHDRAAITGEPPPAEGTEAGNAAPADDEAADDDETDDDTTSGAA